MHAYLHLTLIGSLALGQQEPPQERSPVAVRANTFTKSSQDAAALDAGPQGELIVAWQSRRQQDGTYGIYARRFDAQGQALGDETQINAGTRSHQMQPSVALDQSGGAWFTWRSFGADGDQGSIIARRFDSDLASATSEVLVNQQTRGHQSDPLIVARPDGRALVIWLSPDPDGASQGVFGRFIDPSGQADGDAFRIDTGGDLRHRTPALAMDHQGRALVVYARIDAQAHSTGIYARFIQADGSLLEDELRLDGDVAGIEPVVAMDSNGHAVAAWLAPAKGSHTIHTRSLNWTDEKPVLGTEHTIPCDEAGYTSGLALALDGDEAGMVSWTQMASTHDAGSRLWAQAIDLDGKAVGATVDATGLEAGHQRLTPARGTKKSLLFPGGLMAWAWTGDAQQGDSSGAHLALLGARRKNRVAPNLAVATGSTFGDPEQGARPHDPPIFDPLQARGQISEPTSSVLGGSLSDFLAFSNTGWTPPDPELAVGMDHIVAIVNGGIGYFLKDGTQQFFQDINGSGGFWGSVTSSGFVFDPEVIWDSHSGRFVAFASDANNGFLLAVSDDGDPNGDWNRYLIPTDPIFGTPFVDSGNLAVDDEVITITGDDFNPDRLLMLFIDKASAIAGGALEFETSVINGRQSMGTATNHDPGVQPQYLAWSRESGTSTSISIYAIEDRLTTPVSQLVDLTVPAYTQPGDPPQQGTSVRPNLFESRFWSSVVRDGQLWATHHQGSNRARVRWYQIDLAGWPNSGSLPSLVQSGEVNLGAGVSTFFGSIWVDADQNMALTYARSSSSEFISMNMSYRLAGDPLGSTRAPVRIFDSNGPETTGRWGDYSATRNDPFDEGVFWGIHEYAINGSWRTRIARLETGCQGSVTPYCQTAANSAGPGAGIATTGTPSIAANDLTLLANGVPSNQFGLFFYGPSQTQTPLGDGTFCIGGNVNRLPVTNSGPTGTVSFALDFGSLPPAGEILPGSTWNFQFWYRDPLFGGAGFNFSDAVSIEFCE